MSSVEVLRKWFEADDRLVIEGKRCPFHTISNKEILAFKEALLALEQKQKLKVELGYMLDQRVYVDEEKEKVRKETINKIKELI